MTSAVARILSEFDSLDVDEKLLVRAHVLAFTQIEQHEAINRLRGSGKGEHLNVRLLKDRAEERSRSSHFFADLAELAKLIPDMRAGQLIAAIGELCADLHGRGLWDATDAELLEAVWQFRRNYESATATP